MTAEMEARIDAHELWLRSEGDDGVKLVEIGFDFRGVALDGRELIDADIPAGIFSDMTLIGCLFMAANLASADFTGAVLRDVKMMKANLDHARFDGARIHGGNWFRASTWDTSLDAATFDGTVFDRL